MSIYVFLRFKIFNSSSGSLCMDFINMKEYKELNINVDFII